MADRAPDVVIVGAGAGGGASAWALTRQGIRVLLLESGPSYDPGEDYRLFRNDWEQSRFPHGATYRPKYSFGDEQELDPLWDDLRSWNHISGRFNRTDRRRFGDYSHVRGVGGSTLHFSGEAHRLHPLAMKMRSRFGVAADWPIDYAELEPYYSIIERTIGVAGPERTGSRWRSEAYPLPPHETSFASQKIIHGTRELGLNWEANPLAVLSQAYDGRPFCNYCNNCNRGCPRTDKGSVDVTFIRKALSTGMLELQPNTTVVRIHAGKNDRVRSLEYIDEQGIRKEIETRVLVLSCGAIETPRLLLQSINQHASDGIGNETGQVGRHFMETIFWVSSGLHPDDIGGHRGLPSDIVCWDYNSPDAVPGIVGGCRFYSSTAGGDFTGPIRYAKSVVEGWGLAHKARMREVFGNVLSVGGMGESLPKDGSYIDLDPSRVDAYDLPIARINSHLDENDIRRFSFMANKCRDILRLSGVSDIFQEYSTYDFFNSTHVFGTCRMGEDARENVTNEACRVHRWRNLFIVDASVFPSSGGGESPSLTIEALALRAAGKLRHEMVKREL